MTTTSRKSGFFLIGGKANTCYASFLELAGGPDANIIVIPHASGVPIEASADVRAAFAKLGAINVTVLKQPSRFAAALAAVLYKLGASRLSRLVSCTSIPQGTDAVYISGGDQERLVQRLGPDGAAALKAFSVSGGLISGTSAGAACMGDWMITGGMTDGVIRPDSLRTGRGLGLIPRMVFDTHMRRNRYNRPIVALATLDIDAAIGLDEDAAVWIDNSVATVFGVGNVWFHRRTTYFSVNFSEGNYAGLDLIVGAAGDSFVDWTH
jgi:cyanophycinase